MSARILRTRSGRELRRIEQPRKPKKDALENKKDKLDDDSNMKDLNKVDETKVNTKVVITEIMDKRVENYTEEKDDKMKTIVLIKKQNPVVNSSNENLMEKNDKADLAEGNTEIYKTENLLSKSTSDNIDTSITVPVKRKRGRPRKSERSFGKATVKENHNLKPDIHDSEPLIKKQRKLVHAEEKGSPREHHPSQRKPRMASLNAMAKVNAVLDCYRTDTKKELQDRIKEIDKKCQENDEKSIRKKNKSESKLPGVEELEENVFEEVCKVEKATETDYPAIVFDPKALNKRMATNLRLEMIDECIQTDQCSSKHTQTEDLLRFINDKAEKLCTCPKSSHNTFPYYAPSLPYNYLTNPIHVKASTLVHTNSHTLAIPMVKKHILWDKDNTLYQSACFTNNVSHLVNSCLTNTLIKNTLPCAKLVYLASYKEDVNTTDQMVEKVEFKNNDKKTYDKSSKMIKGLSVPNLNYADISVPTSQLGNDVKKSEKTKTPKKSKAKKDKEKDKGKEKEKEIEKDISSRTQWCNGWEFEGIPLEETVKQNGSQVTRRYYQGLKRNNEELKIHDAVVLKSGNEDADYVARIAALWEDCNGYHYHSYGNSYQFSYRRSGIYGGEMMMSVFWYYKPEQTNGKMNEIKGEEMEVFASRHKDDNSVACIVDRCYVVSFPQFCRFRAQQLISKQQRKQKTTTLVPETKNNRSRFIPSPDTEPSLVFFCRYGYDFRVGKILKSL